MKSDFVIVIHLKADSESWIIELRMIRSSNRESLGHLSASFQPANPEHAVLDLAQRLLLLIAGPAQLESRVPPVLYRVPTGVNFAAYLLRLEQLLAVRCAGMDGVNPSFLNGEREIIDGNLQLCVACRECWNTAIVRKNAPCNEKSSSGSCWRIQGQDPFVAAETSAAWASERRSATNVQ